MSWYNNTPNLHITSPDEQNLSHVTEEEEQNSLSENPLQKRKYTSRACAFCRSLHKKCDGGQPCLRCEQRKQECVYQKHKKRGPKPRTKSLRQGQKPNKRSRSSELNLNGKLKGKLKRRKLEEDYEANDDDEYEDMSNLETRSVVKVRIIWINSQEQISLFFEPSVTLENIKQNIIANLMFGIQPHTHPSMLILSLQENGKDTKVHPSVTLLQLLRYSFIEYPYQTLMFTLSLAAIKSEYVSAPIEEVYQGPVPFVHEFSLNDPSGLCTMDKNIPDLNVEDVQESLCPTYSCQQSQLVSTNGLLLAQPISSYTQSISNFMSMSSSDVVYLEEEPNNFFSVDLDIQHPEGWGENQPNKLSMLC